MMEQVETPTTTEEAPICGVGSESESPCWREATTTHNNFACCAEHAYLFKLGQDEDDWGLTLEAIEEWVRGPVKEVDDGGILERLAINMRDDARREYARARARANAAEFVAQQGPPEAGEPPRTFEQAQELIRRIVHADSFTNARAVIEDAPQDVLGSYDRWVIVDALDRAAQEAGEEATRYKRELGLED